ASLCKPQAHPSANPITVTDLELRAVQARDLIGNREAEAAAAAGRIGNAIETLADRLPLIRWDSRTVVTNREVCTTVGPHASNSHVTTGRDIAYGVVDEVHEHFANKPGDPRHLHGLDLRAEIDAFAQRPIEILCPHVLDELAAVEGREFVR